MRRSQGRDHLEQLEAFEDQGLIAGVLGLVKIGKEASVYCCRAAPSLGGGLVAAKVYRGRQYRFKNDAVYQESRAREIGLRGSGLRAFNKRRKSEVGRQVQSGTWIHHEYDLLRRLFEAGADVPRPLAANGNAILMEYLGDEAEAAPQLNRVDLDPVEASRLLERLMANVELMLAENVVHGDLSPHNVLYWRGQATVIDFPQAVDPRFNRHAFDLLSRDVDNICRYFAAGGVEVSAAALTSDLWQRFTYARL